MYEVSQVELTNAYYLALMTRLGAVPPSLLLLCLALASCTKPDASAVTPSSHDADAGVGLSAPKPRLGNIMSEAARRFETAGKAAHANRFELAAFEIGELDERFEDIPNAELPKEGPTAQIPALAAAFRTSDIPGLLDAAQKKDIAAFDAAFAKAATACNDCHKTSAKAFIEIPETPGRSIPIIEVEHPSPSASSATDSAPKAAAHPRPPSVPDTHPIDPFAADRH